MTCRLRRTVFRVSLLSVVLLWPMLASGQEAAVNLTYDAKGAAAAMLPSKVGRIKNVLRITGKEGTASIYGVDVAVAAVSTPVPGIAIDANGDGKIDASEYKALVNGAAAYDIELKINGVKKKVGILLDSVSLSADDKGVATASGAMFPTGSMKGTVGNTPVRFIDENFDGKITQDGKDSILIGNSAFAMPLWTVHEVAGKNYEIKVEDGKVSATLVKDLELGVVETSFKTPPAALVLEDVKDGRAYDIKLSGAKGIPAGDYRVSYGVMAVGPLVVTIWPGAKPTTYTITAGKINKLSIGEFKTQFVGSYAASSNALSVSADVRVLGAGGDVIDFRYMGRMPEPVVTVTEGEKLLATGTVYY